MTEQNPTLARLEDQIKWYDGKSSFNQSRHKWLKIIEIFAAALIPFTAVMGGQPYIAGALGVIIIILEGLQGLNQYQSNWTNYRSVCEGLKHEKYLWMGKAGPYAAATNPDSLLAERIESLISQEHAKWLVVQEQAKETKEETS